MFGSSVLEVIIGLAFVFLLVSLLVTAANELLANVLQSRAKFLWQGVQAMLDPGSPAQSGGSSLVASFFQHPLIRGMSIAGGQRQSRPGPLLKTPSYISSAAFATALLDLLGASPPAVDPWQQKLLARLLALPPAGDPEQVRLTLESTATELAAALDGAQLKSDLMAVAAAMQPGSESTLLRDKLTRIDAGLTPTLSWVKQPLALLIQNPTDAALATLIAQLPSAGAQNAALLARLQGRLQTWSAQPADYVAALRSAQELATMFSAVDLRRTIEQLPAGDMRQTLLTFLDEAGGQYTQFKAHIETWYETVMDRVSGWYKRHTAWTTLALGAILAVVLNVDAVLIMRHLSSDPSLRAALVANARDFDATRPPSSSPAPEQPPAANYAELSAQINALSLPIGWTAAPPPGTSLAADPAVAECRVRPDPAALLSFQAGAWQALGRTIDFHLVGWLLTAVAASLGAPFWFDLLDKLMNIRQTGSRPKKKRNSAK